jgi:hypothetical protein
MTAAQIAIETAIQNLEEKRTEVLDPKLEEAIEKLKALQEKLK